MVNGNSITLTFEPTEGIVSATCSVPTQPPQDCMYICIYKIMTIISEIPYSGHPEIRHDKQLDTLRLSRIRTPCLCNYITTPENQDTSPIIFLYPKSIQITNNFLRHIYFLVYSILSTGTSGGAFFPNLRLIRVLPYRVTIDIVLPDGRNTSLTRLVRTGIYIYNYTVNGGLFELRIF